MRLSWKTSRSQSANKHLPSIFTLFGSTDNRSEYQAPTVEDGIEVVPIERDDASSGAKMLSPCQDEKEVVTSWKMDIMDTELALALKPLPTLPGSKWSRLHVKHRISAIICVQICIALIIGLSLMSAKKKSYRRVQFCRSRPQLVF
jgi:hypothetical protein